MKPLIHILGVESSCDDTCISIINSKKTILSNIIKSQFSEHNKFKGIVPEIAARQHLSNISNVTSLALEQANLKLSDIDAFCATSGPGLIGGLITGTMFAKALSSTCKKPFIAINHLEGHALTIKLVNNKITYPYLLLLVSGGHSQFIIIHELGKYQIIGQTLDDAIGETFDKVAVMLGFSFPGGPILEECAKLGNIKQYKLPQPIVHRNNCDMSFSGLKTAVKLLINKLHPLNQNKINNIAASFQYTIGEILSKKILIAIQITEKIFLAKNIAKRQLVIAGGVASNNYLKNTINNAIKNTKYELFVPPIELCTDNAAMIAYAGLERFNKKLYSNISFSPRDSWNIEDT